MTTEELEQIRKIVREENEPLQQGQERIEKTQQEQGLELRNQGGVIAHLKSVVEAVAAGQHDVRKQVTTLSGKVATKADVQDIKTDLVKQQRRIENLEENTKTPNPHKN